MPNVLAVRINYNNEDGQWYLALPGLEDHPEVLNSAIILTRPPGKSEYIEVPGVELPIVHLSLDVEQDEALPQRMPGAGLDLLDLKDEPYEPGEPE